jgi:serine phosphatase RsbU (regulator of sigma subunit)/MFS family permease
MLNPLLNALLPDKALPVVRRACLVGILLFPFALAGGFLLLVRNTAPPPVTVTTDCEHAIGIARDFLGRQGAPIASWTGSCKSGTEAALLSFANLKPERMAVWQVAPPVYGEVSFRQPDGQQAATVSVSLDGRVVGFDWNDLPSSKEDLPDGAALKMVLAVVPEGFAFGAPSVDRIGSKREYTFHSSKIPEIELTETVVLQGPRVTSFTVKASADESTSSTGGEIFQTTLSSLGSLFLCAVVLFSIFRHASRTLQQEISHQRSLVVAVLCAVFCVFLGFNAVVNSNTGTVPFAVILLIFAILGVFGGGILAAAYSSGEGDVREAFPGKLTSLDAVITGRVFSRNTGISTLFGLVCGSWLVLALGLVTAPFAIRIPQGTSGLAGSFLRYATIMPLVLYPLMALSFAAAGLLQPLAFLKRYVTRRLRWHIPVLLVCAFLISTIRTHSASSAEFLVTSAVLVASLLAPFFLLDFLATLVSFGVVSSAMGISLSYAIAPRLSTSSLELHAGLALGLTAFGLVSMTRGRQYSEEQVRPLYARHIAERLSLEAEVSAAREAQLRLLPDSVPEFEGLDIAAACVPAETVGGDFYDFFPLGEGRLGVFIAEGNNRGLAAALTIALAKGYLMQCVERFREPVEILARLEAMLASIFPSDLDSNRASFTDFAFASIDTRAGEIRYARTGSYPKVVVVSAASVVASEKMVPVKGRVSPLSEGRATLLPGDHVVLFTDGMGRRLAAGNRKPEEAAAVLIPRQATAEPGSADRVRERFFRDTKASTEPDDLTLVVIRMQARAEYEDSSALGVVA